MVRVRVLLALGFSLLASALPAAETRLGPPITFTEPERGHAAGNPLVLASWLENGRTFVVVERTLFGVVHIFRAPLRDDGTVDDGAAVFLEISAPQQSTAVGRRGKQMLAATVVKSELVTVLLDDAGHALAPPKAIGNAAQPTSMKCGETACFLSAFGGAYLIDASGGVIARFDQGAFAAAAPHSMLVKHCRASGCAIDLMDENGAVRKSFPYLSNIADMIFDGERFVLLRVAGNGSVRWLTMWTIDPDRGAVESHLVSDYEVNEGMYPHLSWNGSVFGVVIDVWMPSVDVQQVTRTLLVGRDFAPLEQPQDMSPGLGGSRTQILPRADGFVVLSFSSKQLATVSTVMLNDGTRIAPSKPTVGGLATQMPLAAASSATAHLAVWQEWDDELYRIRAARRARTGEVLDARALTLARRVQPGPVTAVSDGDNFLVAWSEWGNSWPSANLRAALIHSAAGYATEVVLDRSIVEPKSVRAAFVDGAYQITVVTPRGVEAFTVDTGGTVRLHDRLDPTPLQMSELTSAVFDGTRIAAVWVHGSLWSSVKRVGEASPHPRELVHADFVPYQTPFRNIVLRRAAAGGYTLLYDLSFQRQLAQLSPDGEILPGTERSFGVTRDTLFPSLVTVGDRLYAAWCDDRYRPNPDDRYFHVLVPLDRPEAPSIKLHERSSSGIAIEGWNGEALFLSTSPRQTPIGPIALTTIQVIIPPSRTHAATH